MKIAQVFNKYRTEYGGEVAIVERTTCLLRTNGHDVLSVEKSSQVIRTTRQRIVAFGSSIYSFSAGRQFDLLMRHYKPDVVHVHNLYPLFSPSILVATKRLGIPAVMTIHNQLMTCPVGTHYAHYRVCDKCKEGTAVWCVRYNCAANAAKSINYAPRFSVSRRLRLLVKNTDHFIVQTADAKADVADAGVPVERITVAPNGVAIPEEEADPRKGTYCLFLGRLIHQKGAETLVQAANFVPDIPIKIAGDGPEEEALINGAPANVEFVGRANEMRRDALYRGARIVVFPSQGYESLGLVVLEALSYGVPVLSSQIRGPDSIIQDGKTGIFFEPGSASDLAQKLDSLWKQPETCHSLGAAGRALVSRHYSEEVYYRRLVGVYEGVCNRSKTIS